MDTKINLVPTDIKQDQPTSEKNVSGKTTPAINLTPDNTGSIRPNTLNLSNPIDFSTSTNPSVATPSVNPIDSSLKPNIEIGNEKKKNLGSFTSILLIVFLVIIVALASGILVYIWQSSVSQTVRMDTARLQSQIGNLKSQVEVLQKEKTSLQSEVNRITEEAKNNAIPDSQPAPETQPVNSGNPPSETPSTPPVVPPMPPITPNGMTP